MPKSIQAGLTIKNEVKYTKPYSYIFLHYSYFSAKTLPVCLFVCLSAGGASKAGLKSVKNKKHGRKAHKKEVEAAAEEGDLLSDLSAALTRRRKAMSGKEKEERREERRDEQPHNLGGGSMMDNISRMIPPPSAMGGDDGKGHESDEVDW